MLVVKNFYFRTYLYSEFSGTGSGIAAKTQYFGLEKMPAMGIFQIAPYMYSSV